MMSSRRHLDHCERSRRHLADSEEIDGYSETWLLHDDRPATRSLLDEGESGVESGEALRRIDSVLRKLQLASRSHRQLLEERYAELTRGMRSMQERQARARRTRVTPRKVDRERLVNYLTLSEHHRRFLEMESSEHELREFTRHRDVYHVH